MVDLEVEVGSDIDSLEDYISSAFISFCTGEVKKDYRESIVIHSCLFVCLFMKGYIESPEFRQHWGAVYF